ncbi:MAG: hypothetical protein H0V12_05780, partial [Chloroflexi bacterium]|nr:hypothetical protein [Chloroflexota bacterium]
PGTHYQLEDDTFFARPRPVDPEISRGLLRLDDASRFRVVQVDVAGGGIKLQNTATNVLGLRVLNQEPANAPDESGLPALQTAGLSIVRPGRAALLRERFVRSYALNRALAALDLSPLPPPASGDPAPPADDELFAEDVVRGYRVDVWDDRSGAWHSLCQRVGDYLFTEPEGGGVPIALLDQEDEAFVQMGSTEPLSEGTTRVLRAHESLFTWDGWSLAAPRPGHAILPDHSTGDIHNPAVTPFKMEATFHALPGSLPRLRFGYRYRLRARVADLAGNSVFTPADNEFQVDSAEITELQPFRRFEPVGPPPVMLREVPKEGESLERITVRSAVDDAAAAITATSSERHLAPPKTAQLTAERHHRFDGTPDMLRDAAGYDLASREAGSLTHRVDLVTGDHEPIPGVTEVDDPAQRRTYWLQTNDSFDVPYLPDPLARGVLLLGLPGMATPHEIVDGVNRIAYDGAWPDLRPLRLRVQGLPAGDAPAAPQWDAGTRLLTVQLAQGQRAEVRISSYFHAADLEDLGVWGWTEEAAPADLDDLRTTAIDGRNWLHLPFRELELVHAVQQPLAIPEITQIAVEPSRQVGETTVSLAGTLQVDGASTGKVDLRADWADPLDDPTDPTNDPAVDVSEQSMLVDELTLPDREDDTPTFQTLLQAMDRPHQRVRHAFGDTRYHRVSYTPIASSRFREHFPPAITADPDNLVRPMAGEAEVQTVLDIPNAARPNAPRPLEIFPTFHWSEEEQAGVRTRTRRGGGLRIYMERPWYSSGAGELLGLVMRPAQTAPGSEAAETLRKFTSEWGMDPIWQAEQMAPLRTQDLIDPLNA